MKHIFYFTAYLFLHFLHLIFEFKIMKYSYGDYVYDVEHYNDDINYH